jgi:hypothetical protein
MKKANPFLHIGIRRPCGGQEAREAGPCWREQAHAGGNGWGGAAERVTVRQALGPARTMQLSQEDAVCSGLAGAGALRFPSSC